MLRIAAVKGSHQRTGVEQPGTHDRLFIRSRCSRHGSLPWDAGVKSRRPKCRPARSPTVPGRSNCPAISSRTSSDSVRPKAAARARSALRWAAGRRMVSVSDMPAKLSIVRQPARHKDIRDKQSPTHSHRNATIGSTFAARRAGSQLASKATPSNTKATVVKINGSRGRTS